MHVISRDAPCYYLTSVAKDRLQIVRTEVIKVIACFALDKARKSGGFAIYAYVIMPDHLHVITDSARSSSDTLRFINGIISRRVINWLKEQGYEYSLMKLQKEMKPRAYRYSLWDHHSNVRLLMTERMMMERVHYTHQNPVRAEMVAVAEEYHWSSVRCWKGSKLQNEPLMMNLDRIRWRSR